MMYYRRKIVFGILEVFGNQLTRTQMQKLAFIFSRWQEKAAYDFIPYRFGCYSFQLNQDLQALTKRGYLKEEKSNGYTYWCKFDKTEYRTQLRKKDRDLLNRLYRKFSKTDQTELIKYTYVHYPYHAINSAIAKDYLSPKQYKQVLAQRVCIQEKQLFTIGYEGISLEKYLNKLLAQDVKLLCDVRKNSFSMKYGFSKSQLHYACEQVGITFMHIPELGIESSKRKELKTPKDYQILFEGYRKSTLPENHDYLLKLAGLFDQYDRIAITCFEASHEVCHRGCIASALQDLPDWEIPVSHL